jgi:hypothetical protein
VNDEPHHEDVNGELACTSPERASNLRHGVHPAGGQPTIISSMRFRRLAQRVLIECITWIVIGISGRRSVIAYLVRASKVTLAIASAFFSSRACSRTVTLGNGNRHINTCSRLLMSFTPTQMRRAGTASQALLSREICFDCGGCPPGGNAHVIPFRPF